MNSAPHTEAPRRSDDLWLVFIVLVLVAAGFGLRDPWPADEPRFAVLARDMVLTGDWLFPRVGGDLYQDKPPLYFWMLALGYFITGSVRWSFLIPSLLAACGSVVLVYDLVRRLSGRQAALLASLLMVFTVQFVIVTRAAQIDGTLFFFVTLSLYGLLRHLLLGPAWRWYFIGGLAAGLGVITKGVGFLPLLVLIPYFLMRSRGFQPLPTIAGGWRWSLAAIGFLIGVSVWLGPMLITVATTGDPALIRYRDEILFQQTVKRYAAAWHHLRPWYYFIVEVIPGLWLPLSPLLFWLVPRWRQAFRERDARVWLPLAWGILTLLFFSISKGKRGIYILPVLLAAIIASAPYLEALLRRKGVRRLALILAAMPIVIGGVVWVAYLFGMERVHALVTSSGVGTIAPIAVFVGAASILWLLSWYRQPVLAWPAVVICLALVFSYGIMPRMNGVRSGRLFTENMLKQVPPATELGMMAYKEQFLLYLDRPTVNFGHRRWLEGTRESLDAARWLNARPGRMLLMSEVDARNKCFVHAPQSFAGSSSEEGWYLVRAPASAACAKQGDPSRAISYLSFTAR